MKIHIVQQGDTLWKLAKKYGVDFEQLKAVNNHLSNPDLIMPGMKIKIPTGGVPAKKPVVKKEQQLQPKVEKTLPAKEAPVAKKEIQIPVPPKKEAPVAKKEVKQPAPPMPMPKEQKKPVPVPAPKQPPMQPIIQQPIHQPITTTQKLQHMNMNFNIYKQQPPVMPTYPKIPEPPKLPEVQMPTKVELPKPPVMEEKVEAIELPVVPKVDVKMPVEPPKYPTMPIMQPMQPIEQCYPITGVMPGCSQGLPSLWPSCQPYYPVFQPYPMVPQPYGYGQCGGVDPNAWQQPQLPQQPMQWGSQQPFPAGQPPLAGMPPMDLQGDFDDDTDTEADFPMSQQLPFQQPTTQGNMQGFQPPFSQQYAPPQYGDISPNFQQQMAWGQQQQQTYPMPQFSNISPQRFQDDDEE